MPRNNYVNKPDYSTRARPYHPSAVRKSGDSPAVPYGPAALIGACYHALATLSGRPLPFSRVRVKKFCSPSRFSAVRALASGFIPPVSLDEGLRRTIADEDGAGPGARDRGRPRRG